jgi:hypothetical protein
MEPLIPERTPRKQRPFNQSKTYLTSSHSQAFQASPAVDTGGTFQLEKPGRAARTRVLEKSGFRRVDFIAAMDRLLYERTADASCA